MKKAKGIILEYYMKNGQIIKSVEDFFRCLDKQAGSGSGISTGIIHKLRKIAVKEGFLEVQG